MKTPLLEITIASVYEKNGARIPLPKRMARCTPDLYNAIMATKAQLEAKGGKLIISDLFRSYDMQLQAYLDYKTGKKAAYSPPPPGSMHEAGRAFDLDLGKLKIPLADFWEIAKANGLSPIIAKADSRMKEAWHFDCHGSHGRVYDYYKDGHGTNMESPYRAMAVSAVLAIGEHVDLFGDKQKEAAIQAGLIRLGHTPGNIDGNIGRNTNKALEEAGARRPTVDETLEAVEDLLQEKYPQEFTVPQPLEARAPTHVLG
jgi:hypothetical protein